MIKLMETANDRECDYRKIKELIGEILELNSKEVKNSHIIDLTTSDDLHLIADVFDFKNNKMFIRMSNQKPSGGFLYRNYETNEPESLLKTNDEKKAGVEIYTYGLLGKR